MMLRQYTKPNHNNKNQASKNGIKQVTPELWTSEVVLANGNKIYLNFELIKGLSRDNGSEFWTKYMDSCFAIIRSQRRGGKITLLQNIETCVRDNKFPGYNTAGFKTMFANIFSSQGDYEAFQKSATEKGAEKWGTLANGIGGGLDGFATVVKAWTHKPEHIAHIVYATKKPVNRPFHGTKVDSDIGFTLEKHVSNYSNIIMSMSCVTTKDSVSTTHYGIERNPIEHLDHSKKYSGISMLLHGFAAECAIQLYDKKVQYNNPLESMANIFKKSVAGFTDKDDESVIRAAFANKGIKLPEKLDDLNHVGISFYTAIVGLDELSKHYVKLVEAPSQAPVKAASVASSANIPAAPPVQKEVATMQTPVSVPKAPALNTNLNKGNIPVAPPIPGGVVRPSVAKRNQVKSMAFSNNHNGTNIPPAPPVPSVRRPGRR